MACEASEASETPITVNVIVPDGSSEAIADAIGANYAPGLLNIDSDNVQPLWWLAGADSAGAVAGYPRLPERPYQFNTNFEYTPIMQVFVLNRNDLPPSTTVNTDDH